MRVGDKLFVKEDFYEYKKGQEVIVTEVSSKSIILNDEVEVQNKYIDDLLSTKPVKEDNIKILGGTDVSLSVAVTKSGNSLIGNIKFKKGKQEDEIIFLNKKSLEQFIDKAIKLLDKM